VRREPSGFPGAERILVIGCGGSGKSTFARGLGRATGLPVIHLDSHFWKPGWVEPERREWEERVDLLVGGRRWIIDGNYGGTLEKRLAAADAAVFLDAPRSLCLWRVLRRRLTYARRSRPDMAEGCPERLTPDFLRYVWRYPQDRRPAVLEKLGRHGRDTAVFVLRSPGQTRRFLEELEGAGK
jgi:adenylate kinase family enzyme